MADLDIRAIREWLATQAASATGVTRALSYQPKKVEAADLPLVTIGNPETIKYNRTFGTGKATITLTVTALVSEALDPEEGTTLLDDFVSIATSSLVAQLRNEQSSVSVPWLSNVTDAENYGLFKAESSTYYGVQLVVVVTT